MVALGLGVLALRARPGRVVRTIERTMNSSGQFAVRLAILILVALVYLTARFGLDVVLGAFAAGIVVGLVTRTEEAEPVRSKLEGIGFGFMVPIFFIMTGVDFDLPALFASVESVLRLPVFLALFLVVRGAPVLLLYRKDDPAARLAAARAHLRDGAAARGRRHADRSRRGPDAARERGCAGRGGDGLGARLPDGRAAAARIAVSTATRSTRRSRASRTPSEPVSATQSPPPPPLEGSPPITVPTPAPAMPPVPPEAALRPGGETQSPSWPSGTSARRRTGSSPSGSWLGPWSPSPADLTIGGGTPDELGSPFAGVFVGVLVRVLAALVALALAYPLAREREATLAPRTYFGSSVTGVLDRLHAARAYRSLRWTHHVRQVALARLGAAGRRLANLDPIMDAVNVTLFVLAIAAMALFGAAGD